MKGFDNSVFFNKYRYFICGLIVLFSDLSAHEMWIEPVKFEVAVKDMIYAHEKVGQNFKGNEYSYLSTSYETFDISVSGKTRPIKSRIGDIPAVHEIAKEDGLTILSAITTVSDVTYKKWEKFESFIKSKGLDWVLTKHKERKLPQKDFSEAYSRYAKALIKVGKGAGSDKAFGLPFEWVVETNPYTTNSETIQARLLWHKKSLPNAHVSIFNKIGDELIKTELTTDQDGRINIPKAKGGMFLINAVQMTEPREKTQKQTGAVWESFWASTTYMIKNQ